MKRAIPPFIVSFGITRKCNLKCPHCYSDSGEVDPNELSTGEAKKLIFEIADLGAKLLIFDGGEPTLRADLPELVKYAADRGLTPVLGSNGSFLTRKLVTGLKNAGLREVAISLDGSKPETHDNFRGVSGSWEKAIRAAKNCREKSLPFQIAPLVHSQNWKELPDIVEIAKDLGANAIEIFDFVTAGRGKENDEYELNSSNRKEIIKNIIKWQRKDDITYRVIGIPQYWVVVEKTVPEDEILEKFTKSCCAAGTRYITILPNGDIIPCMVLQKKLGNVRNNRLKDIWYNSQILKTLRDRTKLKGKCGRCKYKFKCGGARGKAYEKTGDYMAEDPTCWFTDEEIQ